MKALQFDSSDYTIVKHKRNKLFYAIEKGEANTAKWQDLIDEEVSCIGIDNEGNLNELATISYARKELEQIWIKTV